jgi:MYXO-CTERM domain-containing protein
VLFGDAVEADHEGAGFRTASPGQQGTAGPRAGERPASPEGDGYPSGMLWAVGIMVLLGWIIGLATVGERVGPVIHVLLALAVVALGYAALRRRRASGKVRPPAMSRDARTRA